MGKLKAKGKHQTIHDASKSRRARPKRGNNGSSSFCCDIGPHVTAMSFLILEIILGNSQKRNDKQHFFLLISRTALGIKRK